MQVWQQKRSWMPWLGLVLISLSGCATKSAATQQAEAQPDAPRAFLWSVEHPDGKHPPLYLLGSVHMMRPDMALPPSLEHAIEDTQVLAVEVDTTQVDPRELQRFIEIRGVRTGGAPSSELMPPELRDRFREALQASGMPWEAAEALRPWVLSLVVSVQMLQEAGFTEEHGVETQLLSRLRESHRVVELESMEEQLDSLSAAPDEAHQYDLERVLAQDEQDWLNELNAMASAWADGDTKAMEAIVFGDVDDPRAMLLHESLFHTRNRHMTERIVERWSDGEAMLVVVGAGHMVGETGLPKLLREKGLKVTQLARGEAQAAAAP